MAASSGKSLIGHRHRSVCENYDSSNPLQNQLNIGHSKYNQWQRKERTVRSTVVKENKQDTRVTFRVGTIQRTALTHLAASSVSRGKRVRTKLDEERIKQQEVIDILELRIKHDKKTTEMYRKRSRELVELNLEIVREIESQECETHAEVKRLLRKYERFRGSIATLNSIFASEISDVKRELEETKEKIQKKLQALEQQVEEMDKKLKIRQDELQVLHSYKDKEYPVKAMMIAKLQTELEDVKTASQENQEELEHIIYTELGKYNKERIRLADSVTHKITEESLALMHPSLQDMALQNMMMKKELEIQKHQQKNLIQRNAKLKEEVAALSKHPRSNLRLQLFPELFHPREKCDPDSELILDIPKQEWLPL